MIETIVVIIIVSLSALAVARKIYNLASGKEDICSGCSKMNCPKKENKDNIEKK
ncbi:hypothetical protein J7L67_00055 [bacterium]|nr:hypothetical protein [bacterium]